MTFVSAMALLLSALGAAGAPDASAVALTVVTTTTDLKALTEAVGGDKVQVTSIAQGYEDPHFIQAKPSYMLIAHKADLWIRIGLELEIGYEGPILDGARNAKIRVGQPGHLDASQGVLLLEVPTTRITRELGDVHPMGNPHYWLDPLNARIMAQTIAGRLSELDPADADVFAANLKTFQAQLDEHMFGKELVDQIGGEKLWVLEVRGQFLSFLDEQHLTAKLGGWMGKMLPFRGDSILVYHRSWDYFANRFGLVLADEMEPKPGVPPTPGHVLEVIDKVNSMKIRALLMEPFYERKAPDLIAEKTGIKVLVCANAVGGDPAAKDYFSMIGNVVDQLASVLEPAQGQRAK
jgi:zinc/manganese transport system substrate-binding protein